MDTAFEVINYEIMMFLRSIIFQQRETLIQARDSGLLLYVNNALTESRVLHIRILTEFLLSRSRNTDIKIKDLLPEWQANNGGLIKELETAYDNPLTKTSESPKDFIDKHLAHATSKRGKSLDWSPVIETMEKPLINLLKALPIKDLPQLALLADVDV